MSVIMCVFWPLWYRAHRMQVKELIDSDVNAAKTLLDSVTAEHDTFAANDPDESSHLHHAKDHLDAFDDSGQIQQKQATITALDE